MRYDALITLSGAIVLLAASAGEVRAQLDLNAGKSGAQMFASNCAACHRSPAGLARGRNPRSVANFLLQHYTARPENAGAIASYLASVRGSAPARRANDPTVSAAPTVPPVRQRPLDKITNATVERLKSFATAANPAVPSDPDAAPRGVKRLEAYAATGTAPSVLRQTAISAALREAKSHPPSAPPKELVPAESGKATEGTTATIGLPADGEGAPAQEGGRSADNAAGAGDTGGAALELRGPPASGAKPSRQSNHDQF